MNILGLHFGHDSAVAVLTDGTLASHVLCERFRRIKHCIGLRMEDIERALVAAGLRPADIDYCAISSTQGIELIIDDPKRFSVNFGTHPRHTVSSPCVDLTRAQRIDPASLAGGTLLQTLYDPAQRNTPQYLSYRHYFPEHKTQQASDFTAMGWIDRYLEHSSWANAGLEETASMNASAWLKTDELRFGSHFPVTVTLDNQAIAGYFINHHSAHAASTFYQSGFDEAAVFTHDGFSSGLGSLSGMFYYGKGNRIYPLAPHHLAAAAQYEAVGMLLNLAMSDRPGN